jgi:hypothetical protein
MRPKILKASERDLVGMPSIRHELFYKFLLISPSYSLAHQIICKGIKIAKVRLPKDFSKVLDTYRMVGNIYDVSFDDWWDMTGRKILVADEKALFVPFKINLANSKKQILAKVSELIDRFDSETLNNRNNEKITLRSNKIRIQTLEERYELAYIKSRWAPEVNFQADGSPGKKRPNWFIALEAKKFLKSYKNCLYINKVKWGDRKTSMNEQYRNYLGMLVDRNLKEALSISENAARREFPLETSSSTHLKFNYLNIYDNRLHQLHFHYENILKKNEEGKKSYLQNRVMKREKIIQNLDKLNNLIEAKALSRAREMIDLQDKLI